MKLIKTTHLSFKLGNSDKVYEVDLCEVSTATSQREAHVSAERYLVNFRYGRRTGSLREGSKTPNPVSLEIAEQLFTSVVVSKMNKGYIDSDTHAENTPKHGGSVNEPSIVDEPTDILVNALLVTLKEQSDSKVRSRIIWRLGELGRERAANYIVRNLNKGDWLEDYAIAWALGRIGAKSQLPQVVRLTQSKHAQVRHMAEQAQLLLSEGPDLQALLNKIRLQLPAALQACMTNMEQAQNSQLLTEHLQVLVANTTLERNTLLVHCYALAHDCPALHQALLVVLGHCPLIPGLFKGIRAIYKTAEFRLDSKIFGLLAQRFETSPAFFRNDYDHIWLPNEGSIKPSQELKKSNTRLAFGHKTREYLRRRNWRSLERLGRCSSSDYVSMATELLLAIHDEHNTKKAAGTTHGQHYGAFSGLLAFNHILYGNSTTIRLSPSRRAWLNTDDNNNQRTECFPELWDAQPSQALYLLKHSHCLPVHYFARRILEDIQYSGQLTVSDLTVLLSSTYTSTCEYALAICQVRLQSVAQPQLLLALLRCSLQTARELGMAHLNTASFKQFSRHQVAALLLITHQDVQTVLHDLLGHLFIAVEEQSALLETIIQSAFESSPMPTEEQMQRLADFILSQLPLAVAELTLSTIERLLEQTQTPLQLLGGNLLVGHDVAFGDISEGILQSIYGSHSTLVRALGTALLGKQSDEQLLEQLPLLVDLYQQGDFAEQKILVQLFQRLANNSTHSQQFLFAQLLPVLFKAAKSDEQRDHIVNFVNSLNMALTQLDTHTLWRLLQAQSITAQRVGEAALEAYTVNPLNPKPLSLKQWVQLGNHNAVGVREQVITFYKNNIAVIKINSREALNLINSPWPDIRNFAFEYFEQHFSEALWQPDMIVFLCDNVKDDVQRFGRTILQKYFKEEDGPEYLLKLSQHPASNVQLFVSNLLEEYAGGQPARILQLRQYFFTVLCLVNQGRLCKDRIYQFLVREAEHNNAVATMVAELFSQLSLTVVHKDKAVLIKAMLQLKTQQPNLVTPLIHKMPQPKPIKNHSNLISKNVTNSQGA